MDHLRKEIGLKENSKSQQFKLADKVRVSISVISAMKIYTLIHLDDKNQEQEDVDINTTSMETPIFDTSSTQPASNAETPSASEIIMHTDVTKASDDSALTIIAR
jgi:hypothetical protein